MGCGLWAASLSATLSARSLLALSPPRHSTGASCVGAGVGAEWLRPYGNKTSPVRRPHIGSPAGLATAPNGPAIIDSHASGCTECNSRCFQMSRFARHVWLRQTLATSLALPLVCPVQPDCCPVQPELLPELAFADSLPTLAGNVTSARCHVHDRQPFDLSMPRARRVRMPVSIAAAAVADVAALASRARRCRKPKLALSPKTRAGGA